MVAMRPLSGDIWPGVRDRANAAEACGSYVLHGYREERGTGVVDVFWQSWL